MRFSSLGWSLSLLFLASCGSTKSHRDGVTAPLTSREKHHLASELEQMAAGWDGMTHGTARDRRQAGQGQGIRRHTRRRSGLRIDLQALPQHRHRDPRRDDL